MKMKKWRCGICGHIQDWEQFTCEGCGADLTMGPGTVIYVDDQAEQETDRRRQEALRRREEEKRRRAEAERQHAEEERRRAEHERRRAEEARQRAEEKRRREELERQRAAEERRKADEEHKRLEAERRGREEAERLRREQEAQRLAKEKEQRLAQQQEEKQRKKQEKRRRKVEKKPRSPLKKLLRLLRNILIVFVVSLLLLMILAMCSSGGDDDVVRPGDDTTLSGHCGVSVTWELDPDTGVMTLSGSGEMYDYGIDRVPWLDYRSQITSLVIEDHVTGIGSWAFAFCENLSTVQFGKSVQILEISAFDHSGLVEVDLPDGLLGIGDNAFSGTLLTEVMLPSNLEFVGGCSFEHCPNLQKVSVLGEGTRLCYDIWGAKIFSDENGDVPEGFFLEGYTNSMVEDYAHIEGYQFRAIAEGHWEAAGECGDDLRWYVDQDSGFLKIVGEGEMWDYNGTWMLNPDHAEGWDDRLELPPWAYYLEEIFVLSVGDGVTSLGSNAFAESGITDVYFGNTVETIAPMAFLESNVDEIVFPDSVTSIGHNAFNWCQNLHYVRLPENLETLEESVFNQCHQLDSLYIARNTVVGDGEYTPFTQSGETDMPDNLTIYGLQGSDAERFANEHNIPFVIGARGMGAEYEGQMGDDAWWFVDSESQTLVIYGTGDTWMYHLGPDDISGWAKTEYEKGRAFRSGPEYLDYAGEIRNVVILPGLEVLNNGAFERGLHWLEYADLGTISYCNSHFGFGTSENLREVQFPQTLARIDRELLHSCTNLQTVAIWGGSEGVNPMVFYNCPNLTEVTFSAEAVILDTADEDLFTNSGDDFAPNENLVFRVQEGSDAERYAQQYGIEYVYYD